MAGDLWEQTDPSQQEQPLTVGQLTSRIKDVLESAFPSVWVVGEISDLARPRSGHVYLTLKDEQSQIRAVIWRGIAAQLRFDLADGQQVVCRGDIDVYLPRGSYQLVIRQIEPRGVGTLQQRLQQLQRNWRPKGCSTRGTNSPCPRSHVVWRSSRVRPARQFAISWRWCASAGRALKC